MLFVISAIYHLVREEDMLDLVTLEMLFVISVIYHLVREEDILDLVTL